jgi:hypothetical protein
VEAANPTGAKGLTPLAAKPSPLPVLSPGINETECSIAFLLPAGAVSFSVSPREKSIESKDDSRAMSGVKVWAGTAQALPTAEIIAHTNNTAVRFAILSHLIRLPGIAPLFWVSNSYSHAF